MFLWRTDDNYPSIIIKYPPYLFHCVVGKVLHSCYGNMVGSLCFTNFQHHDVTFIRESCGKVVLKLNVLPSENKADHCFIIITINIIIILTHLAYTANGKTSCSIQRQFTGRNCVMLTAVLWCHPSHLPCFLDVRWCNVILCIRNVRNTCRRMRYSQIFGGISSVQWQKCERFWRISSFVC